MLVDDTLVGFTLMEFTYRGLCHKDWRLEFRVWVHSQMLPITPSLHDRMSCGNQEAAGSPWTQGEFMNTMLSFFNQWELERPEVYDGVREQPCFFQAHCWIFSRSRVEPRPAGHICVRFICSPDQNASSQSTSPSTQLPWMDTIRQTDKLMDGWRDG